MQPKRIARAAAAFQKNILRDQNTTVGNFGDLFYTPLNPEIGHYRVELMLLNECFHFALSKQNCHRSIGVLPENWCTKCSQNGCTRDEIGLQWF